MQIVAARNREIKSRICKGRNKGALEKFNKLDFVFDLLWQQDFCYKFQWHTVRRSRGIPVE